MQRQLQNKTKYLLWLLASWAFWLLHPQQSQAQVYYAISDGNFNTLTDQLRSIPLAGGSETTIYSNNGSTNFPATPGQLAYDGASGRLFVANAVIANPSIYSVSTSGAASLFLTVSPIASTTVSVVTGMVVDNLGGYLYYNVSDNNFRTGLDQLRRVPLTGGDEQIVVPSSTTGFPATPQSLALDRRNNRLLVSNGVSNGAATGTGNLYVSAVDLTSFAVTRFASFADITANGNTTTTLGGIAVNTADNSLYYVLRDIGINTFNDQLRRISLTGGTEQTVVDVQNNVNGFPTSPGFLAYDAINNRLLVHDLNINNRDIAAVTPGGAISLLLDNGAPIGSSNSGITGIAVAGAQAAAPTVATQAPTGVNTGGATLGGNVTSDGGAEVTERGVVYSPTNTAPVIGGSDVTKDANGLGTGTFAKSITGLLAGTTYYVRAYATNRIGTSYGSVVSFTTPPNAPVLYTPSSGTVLTTRRPVYTGAAQAGSTVTIYRNPVGMPILISNDVIASAQGTFRFVTPGDDSEGAYTAYATATINGATSANSNVNSFTIDATAPTVTNFTSTAGASGGTTPSSPISFSVTFSESVTGLSAAGIQVTNGTVTSGPTGSGAGPYTFEVTPTTPATPTTVQLAANAVRDRGGLGNAASSTYTLTYQLPVTTAPVVNSPANNGVVSTRNPTITGTAPSGSTVRVYLNGNALGTTTAQGGTFSFTLPTSLADDTYTVYATAQSSGQQVSANSATNTFTVDATAPTISSVSVPASGSYGIGKVLSVTVGFSEKVLVSGAPQLGLTIGTTTRQATYVPGSSSASLVFSYTVQSGDLAPNGISLGTLAGGTIRDAAGNDATLTLTNAPATTGIVVDGVAPTVVSSNRENPAGPTTNASSVRFFVTFSESVTGITGNSFMVTNPTGAVTGTIDVIATMINGSNKAASVTVSGISGNGTLRLDVKSSGSGIADLAGNPLSGGFTTGETYTIDQTAPSAVITSSAGASGGQTPTMPIPFTITFSESVTGLSAADISVSNGTIGDFTMNSSSSYNVNVTPQANGLVSVSLAAGVTRDVAGNANTATSPYQLTYRPPVILGTVAVFPGSVCAGSSFTIAATIGRDAGVYNYTLTVGSRVFTGTTANAFSQPVTAQGTGNQPVTLRVSNGVDNASQSSSVTVNPLPTVRLASNGPLTCAQPTVTLTATGEGMGQALTYRFSSPAAQQGGASGNTATVTTAGDYSVTATTTGGCSATAQTRVDSDFSLPTPTLLTQTGQSYPGGQSSVSVNLNTGNVNLVVSGCSGTVNWSGPNNASGTGTTIAVPTTSAGTFVYQATCRVGSCVSSPASATVTVNGRLTVLLRDVDNYADNNAIQPLLQVLNQGAGVLPLSGLTLRYYLTVEGVSPLSNLSVNYAQVGNQNVRLRYVPLTPAQTGAGGYVEVGFADAAGMLGAGANSGNIQLYFAKGDYSALNELDDYSYAPVRDQLVSTLRITAYYNGVLIAGVEPGNTGGGTTPPPTVQSLRALTESKNGPSATQINTFLEIRNEGTTPVNYSELKARYYFTADGNERLQVEVDEGAVSARLVKLPQAVSGADTYLELSFTQGGQLAAGGSTGRIRYRISKPDGGRFDQTNDYSYQERPEQSSQNTHLVVLVGNQVAWGTLPAGASARVAASAEPGSDLTVRVIGNPLTDDQVRVEVTGAQGQPLRLSVSELTGRQVTERHLETAGSLERQSLNVSGSPAGVLLLQVSTPTQSKTIKVLKAQ